MQSGFAPLHGASLNGHKDIVMILLAAGASVDVQNDVSCLLSRCANYVFVCFLFMFFLCTMFIKRLQIYFI